MKALLICIMMVVLLAGCTSSVMTSRKTLTDGTVVDYVVKVNSIGQDFKGSDLSASLNPEGETTVKAGTVDNTTSQVTADVANSMVELIKVMLPYMAKVPVSP